MARRHLLVPYNFSNEDEKSLKFVIRRYSQTADVEVTLIHLYTSVPEVDVRNNPIMEKMSANLAYLKQQQNENEEALEAARKRLVENGFKDDQVHTVFRPIRRDVANDLIDYAEKERVSLVVLNRNPERITRFFVRSVSDKVISRLKDIEVVVVT